MPRKSKRSEGQEGQLRRSERLAKLGDPARQDQAAQNIQERPKNVKKRRASAAPNVQESPQNGQIHLAPAAEKDTERSSPVVGLRLLEQSSVQDVQAREEQGQEPRLPDQVLRFPGLAREVPKPAESERPSPVSSHPLRVKLANPTEEASTPRSGSAQEVPDPAHHPSPVDNRQLTQQSAEQCEGASTHNVMPAREDDDDFVEVESYELDQDEQKISPNQNEAEEGAVAGSQQLELDGEELVCVDEDEEEKEEGGQEPEQIDLIDLEMVDDTGEYESSDEA